MQVKVYVIYSKRNYLQPGGLLLLPLCPELMQQQTCLKHVFLSLLYTLSSEHPAPVLPVVTPVKDVARAKTVTSTVWNKTIGRPLRANLQMNPREFCETGIKIVPGGRLTTNPYLLCILHWQGVN